MKEVLEAYPEEVRLYFKHFPISQHLKAKSAARASLAAHRQGKFWPLSEALFKANGAISDPEIEVIAQGLGLEMERFKTDWSDPAIAQQVTDDKKEGKRAMLTGTPALYINGKPYRGRLKAAAIKSYLEKQLRRLKEEGS